MKSQNKRSFSRSLLFFVNLRTFFTDQSQTENCLIIFSLIFIHRFIFLLFRLTNQNHIISSFIASLIKRIFISLDLIWFDDWIIAFGWSNPREVFLLRHIFQLNRRTGNEKRMLRFDVRSWIVARKKLKIFNDALIEHRGGTLSDNIAN